MTFRIGQVGKYPLKESDISKIRYTECFLPISKQGKRDTSPPLKDRNEREILWAVIQKQAVKSLNRFLLFRNTPFIMGEYY